MCVCVCVCVCVFAWNWRPHCLTPWTEIWHGEPHPPQKCQCVWLSQLPPFGVGQRVPLKACQVVKGQEGLLQVWSLFCQGLKFAGRQGPTQKGQCICCGWIHPPSGQGRPRSASGGPFSPQSSFWGIFHKSKFQEYPEFSGGRSGLSRSPQVQGGLLQAWYLSC